MDSGRRQALAQILSASIDPGQRQERLTQFLGANLDLTLEDIVREVNSDTAVPGGIYNVLAMMTPAVLGRSLRRSGLGPKL